MAGAGCAALIAVAASPLVARSPTSLLPPGFGGDAPAEEPATPDTTEPGRPTAPAGDARPGLQLDLSDVGGLDGTALTAGDNVSEAEELSEEELEEQRRKYDLPPRSARSLERIGPLTPPTGGLAEDAFGNTSGQFLATLMRNTRAPLVSRWGSILLRRTLLSATDTPADINGADWAAERAWMLVRMGEADSARMMVQSVDANRYTDRLHSVAMQAYLASADPVGLCTIYRNAQKNSQSPSWQMAEAICASFAAEQGRASAILNQTERRGRIRGIDYRLTEKMVGAGTSARRSVKIEWDGVDQLTAWRFGLATALNVDIPVSLMNKAGPHVWAWQARAPALTLGNRFEAVETAARLGVFSSAALMDYYGQLWSSDQIPATFVDRAETIQAAYSGPAAGDRLEAMQSIWADRERSDIVPLLAISRAAAALPVIDADGEDVSNLLAAMMTAGYDKSAMRWSKASEALASSDGADGWAMLAVGSPTQAVALDSERLGNYVGSNGLRGRMFLAGLAALGRIGVENLSQANEQARLSFRADTRWARSIETAARRKEKGTVALLAAVGMQVSNWSKMPPEHLYHIVSALNRVGLNAEARMIAAEALMRT
ncbi:MAG: hypothetical protein KDE67_03440 [Sphingobium sp.]|nr:hypothetical protein [Sphingobium sp.]MCP5398884.1 hypothetical protein [Sphingomonas sp.]